MLSDLTDAEKVIGLKQSTHAVQEGLARRAFVAEDAEDKVRLPFLALCKQMSVAVEAVPSMTQLGEACGINVGAAVAVIVKSS